MSASRSTSSSRSPDARADDAGLARRDDERFALNSAQAPPVACSPPRPSVPASASERWSTSVTPFAHAVRLPSNVCRRSCSSKTWCSVMAVNQPTRRIAPTLRARRGRVRAQMQLPPLGWHLRGCPHPLGLACVAPREDLTIYSEPSPDERRFQREAVLRPGDTATHLPTGPDGTGGRALLTRVRHRPCGRPHRSRRAELPH